MQRTRCRSTPSSRRVKISTSVTGQRSIATGLAVFLVALRKANRLTAMSRAMAQQVAGSARSLEQALLFLQNERETCRDESVRLEAKLKDSDRARSEMTRTIRMVERAKNEFKDNVRPFPAVDAAQRAAAPAFAQQPVPAAQTEIDRLYHFANFRQLESSIQRGLIGIKSLKQRGFGNISNFEIKYNQTTSIDEVLYR